MLVVVLEEEIMAFVRIQETGNRRTTIAEGTGHVIAWQVGHAVRETLCFADLDLIGVCIGVDEGR